MATARLCRVPWLRAIFAVMCVFGLLFVSFSSLQVIHSVSNMNFKNFSLFAKLAIEDQGGLMCCKDLFICHCIGWDFNKTQRNEVAAFVLSIIFTQSTLRQMYFSRLLSVAVSPSVSLCASSVCMLCLLMFLSLVCCVYMPKNKTCQLTILLRLLHTLHLL